MRTCSQWKMGTNRLKSLKYIYFACLSWCSSESLYPINVKTAQPIWPQFYLRPHMTLKRRRLIMLKVLLSSKDAHKNIVKSANYFCYCCLLHTEKMHTDKATIKS